MKKTALSQPVCIHNTVPPSKLFQHNDMKILVPKLEDRNPQASIEQAWALLRFFVPNDVAVEENLRFSA